MKNLFTIFLSLLALSFPTQAGYETGAAYQVLRVPAAGGRPVYGAVDISQSAAATGTLPLTRGGTGQTTAIAAFDGLAPASPATGAMLYYDGSHWVKLVAGSNGNLLALAGGIPAWSAATAPLFAQAFHDSDCSWSIPNGNAFADPTADTSCTFTLMAGSTITLTSANDGTTNHNVPGITFTPVSGVTYDIYATATYSLSGSATSAEEFRFNDGSTSFMYTNHESQLASVTHTESAVTRALWTAPNGSAITIKLQSTTNTAAGLTWNGGGDDASNVKSIRWIVTAIH